MARTDYMAGTPGGAPAASGALATDPQLAQTLAQIQMQLAFAESQALAAQRQLLVDYGDPGLASSVLGERSGSGSQYDVLYAGQPTIPFGFGPKSFQTEQEAKSWIQNAPELAGMGMSPQLSVRRQEWQAGPNVLAAGQNPFSTLKRMGRSFDESKLTLDESLRRMGRDFDLSKLSLDESLNKANLWYSSERGRQQGLLGQQRKDAEFDWNRQYGQLGQQRLEAEYDESRRVRDALAEIQRRLAQARLEGQQQKVNAGFQAFQSGLGGL